MTETALTYRFRLTSRELAAGMLLSRYKLRGWETRVLNAVAGGAGLVLIGVMAGKVVADFLSLRSSAELLIMIVTINLVFAALAVVARLNAVEMAATTIESRFFEAEVEWQIDAAGVRMRGAHHDWQTGWQGVTQIVTGKQILVLQIAGMIFVLPHRVIGGEADVTAVRARLDRWLHAARGLPA